MLHFRETQVRTEVCQDIRALFQSINIS